MEVGKIYIGQFTGDLVLCLELLEGPSNLFKGSVIKPGTSGRVIGWISDSWSRASFTEYIEPEVEKPETNKPVMQGKYLITTDAWFIGQDGRQYKSVWGEVEIISDEFLGLRTNRGSTNWYAKIGSEKNHLIVAGCQIHYCCRCENRPEEKPVDDYTIEAGEIKYYKRPVSIYIAE